MRVSIQALGADAAGVPLLLRLHNDWRSAAKSRGLRQLQRPSSAAPIGDSRPVQIAALSVRPFRLRGFEPELRHPSYPKVLLNSPCTPPEPVLTL
jgi:hypothetical protein